METVSSDNIASECNKASTAAPQSAANLNGGAAPLNVLATPSPPPATNSSANGGVVSQGGTAFGLADSATAAPSANGNSTQHMQTKAKTIHKKTIASSSNNKASKLHGAVPAAPRATTAAAALAPPPPPAPVSVSASASASTSSGALHDAKKKLTAEEASALGSRMHDTAKEYARRRETKRKELESKYNFVPKVNKTPTHKAKSKAATTAAAAAAATTDATATATSTASASTDTDTTTTTNGTTTTTNSAAPLDRFHRLHEQAKESQKKKEEARAKVNNTSTFSFKPQITAKAKKLSAKTKIHTPHYENLYKHAEAIRQKQQEKKLELETQQVAELTFKPKLSTSKSPSKPRQLYDLQREKQKRFDLEQKRLAAELNECTFKPNVTSKLHKPVKDTRANANANATTTSSSANKSAATFDRLYNSGLEKQEKLERLRQEYEEKEKLLIPFQPQISSSGPHAPPPPAAAMKQPFHERLYSKDHLQKTVAEREARKLEEETKFSFKPTISEVPEEIKTKSGSTGKEESKEQKSIFDRLYEEKDRVKEKIEQSEEIKKQREMEGCTFKPQIAVEEVNIPLSSQPVWERLASFDKNQVIEEREKLKEQLELQECTFKPEISPMESLNSPKRSPSLSNSVDQGTGSDAGLATEQISSSGNGERSITSHKSLSSMETRVAIDQILKSSKLVLAVDTSPTSA